MQSVLFVYRNVVTEMSPDRNGQTETAQTKTAQTESARTEIPVPMSLNFWQDY